VRKLREEIIFEQKQKNLRLYPEVLTILLIKGNNKILKYVSPTEEAKQNTIRKYRFFMFRN